MLKAVGQVWALAERRQNLVLAGLVALGVLVRLAWLAARPIAGTPAIEPTGVAMAIVTGAGFADAYGPGTGPTAHLSPLVPLIPTAAYGLFGPGTPAAEIALSVLSIGLIGLISVLLWRCLAVAGAPLGARVAATAIVSVLPLQFVEEIRLAHWEQLPATALMLWAVLRILRAEQEPATKPRWPLTTAIIAVTCVLSPPAGLGAGTAFALHLLTRRRWRDLIGASALFLALLAAILVPWAFRNERVLGEPVLYRSNAGLELNLSNHDGILSDADPAEVYLRRLKQIHLAATPALLPRWRAMGGELAYNRAMMNEAKAWIAAHPAAFARRSLERLVEFFFPPLWFWGVWGGFGKFVLIRNAILWGAAGAAIATAVFLARRQRAYGYLLCALLAPAIPYLMVQPLLRYRYIISGLTIFLACDGAVRLWRWWRGRTDRRSVPFAEVTAGR